jgi:putative endonuclease
LKDERRNSTRPWYVYVLKCGDGTLYTGVTNDPEARLKAHRTGRGAKYTRGRAPLRVLAVPFVGTRGEALSEERRIKRMSRAQKLSHLARATAG